MAIGSFAPTAIPEGQRQRARQARHLPPRRRLAPAIYCSSDRRRYRARHNGIGNHGDDTVTTIALPFPYTLYDQSFTSINLSSNGNAQFVTTDTTFTNVCLPWAAHNYTIFPYWDDLYLVNSGFGIFTSVSGTAPNRIFNIEWRAQYFPGSGNANFELRLYEGQRRFDVIYGIVDSGNTSATAGVQKNTARTLPSTSAMAVVLRLLVGKATR